MSTSIDRAPTPEDIAWEEYTAEAKWWVAVETDPQATARERDVAKGRKDAAFAAFRRAFARASKRRADHAGECGATA